MFSSKSTAIHSGVDLATTLPPELWLHIFDCLPRRDVLQLSMVHRTLYAYVRPRLWQKLTGTKNDQIKALLRELAICSYITDVAIKATIPASRERSILRWRPALISDRSTNAALKVLSRLKNIQTLSVSAWSSEEACPALTLYRGLWDHILADQLRCLHLKLGSSKILRTFSSSLRGSSITFKNLDTLILQLCACPGGNAKYHGDLKTITDTCRCSVRSVAVRLMFESVDPYSDIDPTQAPLKSLGTFPHLRHFDFATNATRTVGGYTEFLTRHQSTLTCLQTTTPMEGLLPLIVFNAGRSFKPSWNIKTLNMTYEVREMSISRWNPIPMTNFTWYARSLTTLILVITPASTFPHRGLEHNEVKEIITHLDQPPNGVLLERLRLTVSRVSPQLIDLIASYLGKLHTLDLQYFILVQNKDALPNDDDESGFFDEMKLRHYPNWNLQSIDMNTRYGPNLWRQSMPSMLLLASCIPAIRRYGPFDWSDAEVSPDSS
ncbi:hypothetical protein BDN72DRAFT_847333 [Pluteus cervinus]|uniref:Uncharacterized protein n=1 Tax=Pluteus cervinus TaxID=181527 RepID=A0ACD3ADU2_9AGAR|nr:hypothetical protein BDN72DRAFT_847333 [Pluteus cervinus]